MNRQVCSNRASTEQQQFVNQFHILISFENPVDHSGRIINLTSGMDASAFSRRLRVCGNLHGTSNVQISDSCFSWHGSALSTEKISPRLFRSHSAFILPLTRTRQLSPSGRTHTSNAFIAILPARNTRIRAKLFNHFFYPVLPSLTLRPPAQQRPPFVLVTHFGCGRRLAESTAAQLRWATFG